MKWYCLHLSAVGTTYCPFAMKSGKIFKDVQVGHSQAQIKAENNEFNSAFKKVSTCCDMTLQAMTVFVGEK